MTLDRATSQAVRRLADNTHRRGRPRVELARQAGVAIGCVGLFIVFSALTSTFYQPANLLDIMLQSSINAVIVHDFKGVSAAAPKPGGCQRGPVAVFVDAATRVVARNVYRKKSDYLSSLSMR
jgi:hypothetical protein